jgi:transcription elongation GreA/GreB family factor
MEKQKIVNQLILNVNDEIGKAKQAYGTSREHASDQDMKPDGKYDTRSIEAGYLAGAQKVRADELELELKLLEDIEVRAFMPSDEIAIGALVEIELNKNNRKYFISPTAGGTMLNIDGEGILVISVFSPIGNAVLGLITGDSFELETPKETRIYTIKGVR